MLDVSRGRNFIDISSAMELQLKEVQELEKHSLVTRVAEGTKDADKILKALRNINSLCDMFQVSFQILNLEQFRVNQLSKIDTQLCIERRVEDIDMTVHDILQVCFGCD
jgi:hypothetical protein